MQRLRELLLGKEWDDDGGRWRVHAVEYSKANRMHVVDYAPADLVTAADTSAEHAAACADLVASLGELYNAGPLTPGV